MWFFSSKWIAVHVWQLETQSNENQTQRLDFSNLTRYYYYNYTYAEIPTNFGDYPWCWSAVPIFNMCYIMSTKVMFVISNWIFPPICCLSLHISVLGCCNGSPLRTSSSTGFQFYLPILSGFRICLQQNFVQLQGKVFIQMWHISFFVQLTVPIINKNDEK